MANNTLVYIPNDSHLLQLFHYYIGDDQYRVLFIQHCPPLTYLFIGNKVCHQPGLLWILCGCLDGSLSASISSLSSSGSDDVSGLSSSAGFWLKDFAPKCCHFLQRFSCLVSEDWVSVSDTGWSRFRGTNWSSELELDCTL